MGWLSLALHRYCWQCNSLSNMFRFSPSPKSTPPLHPAKLNVQAVAGDAARAEVFSDWLKEAQRAQREAAAATEQQRRSQLLGLLQGLEWVTAGVSWRDASATLAGAKEFDALTPAVALGVWKEHMAEVGWGQGWGLLGMRHASTAHCPPLGG